MGGIMEILRRVWRMLRGFKGYLKHLFGIDVDKEPQVSETKEPRSKWWERWKLAGFKKYDHHHSGPNAPKRQPCMECHGWRKRTRRGVRAASYHCSRCDIDNIITLRG